MIFALIPDDIAYILSIFTYSTLINILYYGYSFYFKKWWDGKKQDNVLLVYSIMCLFLMIGRIIFVIFDYFLTDFDLSTYNNYLILWKAGMAFVLLGYGIFLYIITQNLTKYNRRIQIIILLIYCIPILVMLFMNTIESAQLVSTISLLSWIVVPIGFIYMASQSAGELRKNALKIMIGVSIYALSYVIVAEFIVQILINDFNLSRYDIHIISAIGKSIGILLVINSYKSMLIE